MAGIEATGTGGTLFESSIGIRGVSGAVMVVLGLNNKKTVIDPLIETITQAGFHCLRLSLYQSDRTEGDTAESIANRWVGQVEKAYDWLMREYRKPVFSLSYSTGALATLQFLQKRKSAEIHGMALFAPPVVLTPAGMLVHLATPLSLAGLGRIGLPSLAPDAIRARPATPVREYAAMSSLMDVARSPEGAERIGRVPTLVFVDEADEVVSYGGIRRWIQRHRLEATWRLEPLPVKSHNFRHLAIMALEDETWRQTREKLVLFFEEQALIRSRGHEPKADTIVGEDCAPWMPPFA